MKFQKNNNFKSRKIEIIECVDEEQNQENEIFHERLVTGEDILIRQKMSMEGNEFFNKIKANSSDLSQKTLNEKNLLNEDKNTNNYYLSEKILSGKYWKSTSVQRSFLTL